MSLTTLNVRLEGLTGRDVDPTTVAAHLDAVLPSLVFGIRHMTDDTRKVVRDGAKRFFAWQGAQGVIERRDTAQAVTWVVTCYTDTWEECAFLGIEQYEMGVVCVWVMEAPPPLAHNLRVWLEGHWRVTDLDPTNAPTAVPIEKPLLPDRANPAQWNSWFDWYYRQPWGKPPSLAHMVQVASKSRSTIEKQHALWRTEHR